MMSHVSDWCRLVAVCAALGLVASCSGPPPGSGEESGDWTLPGADEAGSDAQLDVVDAFDPPPDVERDEGVDADDADVTADVARDTSRDASGDTEEPDAEPDTGDGFPPDRPSHGGAWGDEIDGQLNVWVYGSEDGLSNEAFVMVESPSQSTRTKWVAGGRRLTFDGIEEGPVTVSAAAPAYSGATIQRIDTRNVSLVLHPSNQPTSSPAPPTATFEGRITGMNQIDGAGPNTTAVAWVRATRASPWASNPDPGEGNIVTGSSNSYSIDSPTGDLALVVLGGLYDERQEIFRPQYLGVERNLTAEADETYQRDLALEIPTDESMSLEVSPPVDHNGRANVVRGEAYLDLGSDGVVSLSAAERNYSSLVPLDDLPALEGKLSDVGLELIAGAYTWRNDGSYEMPLTVVRKRNVTSTANRVDMGDWLGLPLATSGSRQYWSSAIAWTLEPSNRPDLYMIRVTGLEGQSIWEAFLPPDLRSFEIPSFPESAADRLNAYPEGEFRLMIQAIEQPASSFGSFRYSDLSARQASRFGIGHRFVRFSRF